MASFITSPYPVFFDKDGTPLENGSIYIGQPNLNPETSPVTVYWDEALTQPAAQPIRTLNGYPSRAGTPSRFYIQGGFYSIMVRNRKDAQVYYSALSSEGGVPSTNKLELVVATANQTTFNLSTINYVPNTNGLEVYRNGLLLLASDYSQTSSTQVVMVDPADDGDEYVFIATVAAVVPNQTAASFAQEFATATAGQTVFNLTTMTYANGTGALVVLRNGIGLRSGLDYIETSPTQVTMTTGASLGDEYLFLTIKNT